MGPLAKLLQHVLIWAAATVAILIGTVWGQAVGFLSHRTERRALAWIVLTIALIFAAALVQRAPLAVAVLVAFSAALGGLGLYLLSDGSSTVGVLYVVIAAVYVVSLGPSLYRWYSDRP